MTSIPKSRVSGFIRVVTLVLSCFLVLSEAITGFLLANGSSIYSVSAALKGTLFVLVILYLLLENPRELGFPSLLAFILFSVSAIQTMLDGGRSISGLYNLTKVLLPFFVLPFCHNILSGKHERPATIRNLRGIRNVLLVNSVVFFLNIAAGIFGYGYATYRDGVGISGYFYAGNEVSGLYIVCYAFLLLYLSTKNARWPIVAASLILSSAGLLIGTKTAILSAGVIPLAVYVFVSRSQMSRRDRAIIDVFLVGVASAGVLLAVDLLSFAGITDRLTFIYRNQGFLGLIFANRLDVLSSAMFVGNDLHPVRMLLLGLGQHLLQDTIGKGSVEIDIIDLFFWYGMAGLVIAMSWTALTVRLLCARKRYAFFSGILLSYLLIVSSFSGHIMISGMLAFPLPYLVAYLSRIKPKKVI